MGFMDHPLHILLVVLQYCEPVLLKEKSAVARLGHKFNPVVPLAFILNEFSLRKTMQCNKNCYRNKESKSEKFQKEIIFYQCTNFTTKMLARGT